MIIISNNAELMSALSMAQGGERIEIAPGDYGDATFRNVAPLSDVTIVSADPDDPAIFHDIYVRDSSHLVFDGILFDYTFASGNPIHYTPFQVIDSTYITFRNSVFSGDESDLINGVFYGTSKGLVVRGSSNIIIDNNEFFHFWKALTVERVCADVYVSFNEFHSIRTDGCNFISVDGLLIEGNWFHDFKLVGGDHADMIQFWQVLNEPSLRNVIVRGNFFDAGAGDLTQSLFMRNGIVDTGQGSFAEYAYLDVLIEDNVIYNAHLHGLTVGETDGLTIRNNTILFNSAAKSDSSSWAAGGWGTPRINLKDESINVVLEKNITEYVVPGDNLVVQHEDPGGSNYYGDLFVSPSPAPASLANLLAIAGGVIEAGGYGAAMTRADLPMIVGPYPAPDPGVCEALLAEALTVVADLEVQLAASQAALASMTGERDTAEADGEATLLLLAAMTIQRDLAVASLSDADAALMAMTAERDAALASDSAALFDLSIAQTQLSVAVGKLASIHTISEI